MTIIPTHRLLAQRVRVIERRQEGSIVQFMDGSVCKRPIPDHDMVAIPVHAAAAEAFADAINVAVLIVRGFRRDWGIPWREQLIAALEAASAPNTTRRLEP